MAGRLRICGGAEGHDLFHGGARPSTVPGRRPEAYVPSLLPRPKGRPIRPAMSFFSRAAHCYVDSFRGFRSTGVGAHGAHLREPGGFHGAALPLAVPDQDMGLTLEDVGWIVAAFGSGSVLGSWLGGRLTDRQLGFYDVMLGSLTSGWPSWACVSWRASGRSARASSS